MSKSLQGRTYSDETKKKMSNGQKRRFERDSQWNDGISAKDNPSMSRYSYEITTNDGEVIFVDNGIQNFCMERFGTSSNIFRHYFNKGKIPPVAGKGKSRASSVRREITDWEVKRMKKC